jgi:hypothetical protein
MDAIISRSERDRLGSPTGGEARAGRAGGIVGKDLASDPEAEAGVDAAPVPLAGDRRCPQCGVKLSQYNPGPNCWQHTIGWPWRGPSAKPRF